MTLRFLSRMPRRALGPGRVSVQGWRVFEGEQPVTLGHVCWELSGGAVPGKDRIALVVCELDKVAMRYNGLTEDVLGDDMLAWLYVLAQGHQSEEVERIMERLMGYEEYHELYGLTLGDPVADRQYAAYEDGVMTRNDAYSFGHDDGIAETVSSVLGILEGSGVDESALEQIRALGKLV